MCLDPLQELYLNNNEIGDDGVKALASAISSGALEHCESIDLANNSIGDEGMKALAQAIAPVSAGGSGALKNCHCLVLEDNQIGDDGMRSLADALAKGAMANTKVSSKPSHSCSGLRLTAHTLLTLLFCTH